MSHDPAKDLATFIAAAGLGLTLGTNLVHGPLPAAGDNFPDAAVAVFPIGGPSVQDFQGPGLKEFRAALTVLIRSAKDGYQAGRDLAQSIIDAAHAAPLSGYVDCSADAAEPAYRGPDESQHHYFAVPFRTIYEE